MIAIIVMVLAIVAIFTLIFFATNIQDSFCISEGFKAFRSDFSGTYCYKIENNLIEKKYFECVNGKCYSVVENEN